MPAALLPIETASSEPGAGVATIWLDQPERAALVLDRALLEQLDATLDRLGKHPAGVVVASRSARVYVAGADLGEIQSLSDHELDEYLAFGQRVLGRLAALPCMTVAAIDGAALGGGLELAMHCDAIVALRATAEGKQYPIGLPEATLGLCPGWGGTNLLPARVEPSVGVIAAATGSTMTPAEARAAGLVAHLYDSRDELLAQARQIASQHKPARSIPAQPVNISMPEFAEQVRVALERVQRELPKSDAAQAVASAIRAGISAGWDEALRTERRELIRLRSTTATQEKLKAFFERRGSKKA